MRKSISANPAPRPPARRPAHGFATCLASLAMAAAITNALAENPPPLPNPLTLNDARQQALAGNPGLLAAAARLQAAQAVVGQTRSTYLPQLSATGNLTHFDGRQMDAQSGRPARDSHYSYGFGARADWLLFDGFARHFNHLAAKLGEAVSDAAYADVQRLLLQSVAFAFHSALLAQEQARIARQDAQFNQELSDETGRRFAAGAAARSEVLNFDIRVAQAESALLIAERGSRTARTILAELLGLDLAKLPDNLQFATPEDHESNQPLPTFASEIAYAEQHRPDLLAASQQVALAEARQAARRGTYLPTISLQAGYQENYDRNLASGAMDSDGTYAGIYGTWILFDGLARENALHGLAAATAEAIENQRTIALAVASELHRAIDLAAVARQEVDLQKRIHEMTRQARELVRSEYTAGRANLTRLNEAQTDLVRAESVLAQAKITFWQAIEDVAAAAGR